MKPYKARIEETVFNEKTKIPGLGAGYCVTIQSIFYDNRNPSDYVYLFDADGDGFISKIPGQGADNVRPGPISVTPVTVKLPLSYLDTAGECQLIIWGEVNPIETKQKTF